MYDSEARTRLLMKSLNSSNVSKLVPGQCNSYCFRDASSNFCQRNQIKYGSPPLTIKASNAIKFSSFKGDHQFSQFNRADSLTSDFNCKIVSM